jgi:ABC-type polysaccharide/polyol phosphate export permease
MINIQNLILDFLKRDLKAQYAGSVLGLGWLFLGPVFQIALYAVVFGLVFKTRPMVGSTEVPYVVYLCSALIPWTIYSNTIARLCGNFLEHGQYIRKLNVPKWIYVAYVSLSSCVQFLILFCLFLVIAVFFNVPLTPLGLMNYLVSFAGGQLIATGIGLTLAVLTVFVRDVSQMVGIALQLMFWGLPICYSANLVPESMNKIVMLNPFWSTVTNIHAGLFSNDSVNPSVWAHAVSALVFIWGIAALAYKRIGPWVVDEL